ncbi:E3 ubiquitin-protein ligase RGLG4-like isoform X2 [Euphorbia lathyris]|uniref:E3 ubiquitin-protein ligase RGLG4-like isoform X2 n=1 Tax=Euphorbia lathyris TaxID=212925 RepID=UPI00331386B7
MIPCFGFGDASAHDQDVFGFYLDEIFCNGFEEALSHSREIVPNPCLVNESGCGILQQDILHFVNKFIQPKTGSCRNNGGADCRFVKGLGVQEEEKQSPVRSNWLVYSNLKVL